MSGIPDVVAGCLDDLDSDAQLLLHLVAEARRTRSDEDVDAVLGRVAQMGFTAEILARHPAKRP